MDIIHLLPDSVANQIAAGEVVQRPASVIKELLENAVDAGATEIQIFLREAGRDLIQVIDNGKGMSPTDARMAFERHATSKIQEARDLFALHTMGFRGEALASIAAVAEVELHTRRQGDETGVGIEIEGSKFKRQETITCPVGANFIVRNLFYNVPARRKFLKSNATEYSNILTELQHVALANPQVGFSLTHNDVLQFQWQAGNLRQRITQIFARKLGESLLPVEMENDLLQVTGFVGTPETARKKGSLQYLFVNDRYMRHPYFHKAVATCYEGLIPNDAQPNYFIYLKVDPATIDVNIHPTKTEIKFENEPARWHILMATVKEALGRFNAVPSIDFDVEDMPEIPVTQASAFSSDFSRQDTSANFPAEPRPQFDRSYDPFRAAPSVKGWQNLYDDFKKDGRTETVQTMPGSQDAAFESEVPQFVESRMSEPDDHPVLPLATTDDEEVTDRLVCLQTLNRYIVTSLPQGLLVIDQHKASVCVLFAQYIEQIAHRQGYSQQELFPEIVQIPLSETPFLEQILPELSYLGFQLDNLGGGSYAINGRPASLEGNVSLRPLLFQMIEAVKEETSDVSFSLDKRLALRLAQAQAIPSGKPMPSEAQHKLLKAFLALPQPAVTPDGHAAAVFLDNAKLDNLIK